MTMAADLVSAIQRWSTSIGTPRATAVSAAARSRVRMGTR